MKTAPEPPSEAVGFRLATAYLARRAASKLQLRRYLLRKFGRPGSDDGEPPNIEGIVAAVLERLERLQLINDVGLAQSRARQLVTKGFGRTRLRRELSRQGFDLTETDVAQSLDVEDEAQAVRYAERKRLGPYAADPRRSSFDRDVRALVRAGFGADVAVRVMRRLRAASPADDADADVNAS